MAATPKLFSPHKMAGPTIWLASIKVKISGHDILLEKKQHRIKVMISLRKMALEMHVAPQIFSISTRDSTRSSTTTRDGTGGGTGCQLSCIWMGSKAISGIGMGWMGWDWDLCAD